MKLESLQDLKKLIDLCRKTGVETIKVDGLELKLGAVMPDKPKRQSKQAISTGIAPGGITDNTPITFDGMLTDEEMLFYSAETPASFEQN